MSRRTAPTALTLPLSAVRLNILWFRGTRAWFAADCCFTFCEDHGSEVVDQRIPASRGAHGMMQIRLLVRLGIPNWKRANGGPTTTVTRSCARQELTARTPRDATPF